MKKPLPVFFAMKVVGCMIAGILILLLIPFSLVAYIEAYETPHYYEITRLNINGEIEQTYIAKGRFPWVRNNSIEFNQYPSGHRVLINSRYTVEDLGTSLNAL